MPDKQITSIAQVKKGDFVKFVDRDKQGRFSYIGEVISVTPGKEKKVYKGTIQKGAKFEMLTFEGVMGFYVETGDENEIYLTDTKPKGWAKFKKDPTGFKEELNAPQPPKKSRKELVADLVAANPRKKEASLLTMAKKEIGGSEATLKNYIKLALVKK